MTKFENKLMAFGFLLTNPDFHINPSGLQKAFDNILKAAKEELWHDVEAEGCEMPDYDREVIAITYDGKVVFAHRPDPAGWEGRSMISGEIEHFRPYTFDGWNIPDIRWWLDIDLPTKIYYEP